MSSNKKTFILRMSEDNFKAISKWAEDEFRSINGQIEMIIERALKESGRKKSIPTKVKQVKTNS